MTASEQRQIRRDCTRRTKEDPTFQYESPWAPYFFDRREEATRWRPEETGADLYCFPIGERELSLFPALALQLERPRRPSGWIGFEVSEAGVWCEIVLSEEDGATLDSLR